MASSLLSKYCKTTSTPYTQRITPTSANWKYVAFEVCELKVGQTISLKGTNEEVCLVLVAGKATVNTPNHRFENIGDRMSPFERKKPYAVYISAGEDFEVSATTDLELAICKAPGKGNYTTRLISPDDIDAEQRGTGNNKRYVHNILPDNKDADSLLVVEVYTDEGCTSSYPSHKHDRHFEESETYLEETYYHRLNPEQGFCMQRVYTDDRELDESMAVYNKDVVMVPKGYHPVATIAGYDSYYLNVMAGPVREWRFTWETDHNWINSATYAAKHATDI